MPPTSSSDDLDMRSTLGHDSLILFSSVVTDLEDMPVAQRLNCSDPDKVYEQGSKN